ncbi:MAG: efflux RND transporter periplasmic adaptor subunit [Chloroflexi bacterium]|nr:efflux RND transporter periplasmic adaptor subunit [Chloroflexota bacterium]MBU1748232.1 efflux RND transporter periplasmic adaptor subunit [Chloroflexota bacterium]MBU1877346.1 efflux RND transporter periplasmic adaptor subunit [Chloroflexota bacterium]
MDNKVIKWITRVVIAGVLVVAVSGIGYAGYVFLTEPRAAQATEVPETWTVERGDIQATVSVSGSVVPQDKVNVSFKTGGQVARVLVTEGDVVHQGDLLVTLDTTDLETQIEKTESALRIAQLNLQKAQKPLGKDEVTVTKANLERARINLQRAQSEYDKIAWRSDAALYPQAAQLELATLDYQVAQANYNIQVRGATAEDLALLSEQVKQAEMTVASTRRALDDAQLKATIDGTVLTVNAKQDEFTNATLPAVVLADLSCLQVDVQIDETEIGQVTLDQDVLLTLDAFGEQEITGRVTEIALAPTVNQGVVNYLVTITLDSCELSIKIGMTANANIVVAEKQGVLLVPNRTIRLREGKKQVQVWRNNVAEWVFIETGLNNDQFTEVMSGLQEGDLVITKITATNNPLSFGFGG